MYHVAILKDRFYWKYCDTLLFNYCMVMAGAYYKHKLKFFPIRWTEDDQVSNVKLFSQAITVLRFLGSFAFHRKHFMESEHRIVPREKYSAKQVA